MRYILPIIALCLLGSCSDAKKAQYHYKKAVRFGLSIANDTIKINTIDSVAVIVNDTIIWEKFITTKDTIIQILEMPKTRYQTRIEYRYKTKVLKQDVLKYKYIYTVIEHALLFRAKKYDTGWVAGWMLELGEGLLTAIKKLILLR